MLRIGGDSTDASWWPTPGIMPPAGVSYALTPGWLKVAHAVAAALNARMILGVNLAANSPTLAATEARALLNGVGRQYIAGLEIGNEPDIYAGAVWYRTRTGEPFYARTGNYGVANYSQQFSEWRSVMPTGAPIIGGAFAEGAWMEDLSAFLSAEPGLAAFTYHRYPLRSCVNSVTSSVYPSIPNLMNETSSAGLADGMAPYIAIARADDVPFRVDELNSASCKGKLGVSNAFASALWVLETLFDFAGVGVDGVNVHTLPGAPYAPFSFTHTAAGWSGQVNPLYYGMLMFTQAFPTGADMLATAGSTNTLKAFATRSSTGIVRIELINKDPDNTALVHLTYPGGGHTTLTTEALSAPSLGSTSGVTLGGQSFGPSTTSGVLAPPQTASISPLLGGYTVTVPAASAVLLTS